MKQFFFEFRSAAERLLKQDILSLRAQFWALAAILLICVLARIEPTHYPLLDRTLWKEIDYIEISKNYWHDGLHFLKPEIT